MRGMGLIAFLAAILAVVLIMAFAKLPYDQAVIKSGNEAREQAQQVSGYGPDGVRNADTVTFATATTAGGKMEGIRVTSLVPGGAMQSYYGLQVDDVILQAGPHVLRDWDEEMAEAMILEAPQRQQELIVRRNGQQLTLTPPDIARQSPLAPGVNVPNNPPVTGQGLQRQLQGIQQGIGGGGGGE